MVIAPVDQREADQRAFQPMRRSQSAETGADNHHAMGFWRLAGSGALRRLRGGDATAGRQPRPRKRSQQ
jgi:hypothetical protein